MEAGYNKAPENKSENIYSTVPGGKPESIYRAAPAEFREVQQFYYEVTDAAQEAEFSPGWIRDIYPAPGDLKAALAAGQLFVKRIGGKIISAMVVNGAPNEAYDKVHWPVDRKEGDYLIIHMLAVHPEHTRKGYAQEMVRFVLGLAQSEGRQAVRLDVLKGNLAASKLYLGLGFQYYETVAMFYEDTGWADYEIYEYVVNGK